MGSIGPDRGRAQEFTPHLYPPFPEDFQPCVELETLSLSKILSTDTAEQTRLYEICKTQGFFYLDMTDTYAASLPQEAEKIGHLSEDAFKLPLETKMKYSFVQRGKSIFGYKEAGFGRVEPKASNGKTESPRDTAEFFNCSKDTMLENPGHESNTLPPILSSPSSRALIGGYQETCHKVGLDIMNNIGAHLGLDPDTFGNLHRITELAGDHVRMTRSPPRRSPDLSNAEISVPGHTDFGTITILFNWMGGLQVWSEPSRGSFHNIDDPDTSTGASMPAQWLWVKPKQGHAIVNLGDAAVKFSRGVLCSGRHRVVPAPGEQGLWPRYSLVYFVRPENQTVLKALDGKNIPPAIDGEKEEEITAAEWILRQTNGLRGKD